MTIEQVPAGDIAEMLATMDRLSNEIRDLRIELGEARELHTKELRTMNIRTRRVKLLTLALALLVVVGCVFVYQNRKTLDDFHQQRTEARHGGCIRDNVSINAGRIKLHNALLSFVPNPDKLTPEELEATLPAEQVERIAAFDKAVADAEPFRDCSAAGIEAYYSDPPPDPATQP